jgi:hypothetical protein
MSAKAVVAVIIVAILIGVLYVLFEKNFTSGSALSNSNTTASQELGKKASVQTAPTQTSLLNLPSPESSAAPITESTDLLKEAEGLEMRDYSTYFEELKDTVSK